MIQIRPISDLTNKYLEIKNNVENGDTVFLTKMDINVWFF